MGLIWDKADAFTAEECDRIIALGAAGDPHQAPVYGKVGEEAVEIGVRDVMTSYRARSDETAFIYDRLDALFAEAAIALGHPVGPIFEQIQILRYGLGSHFSLWHSDAGVDTLGARILSVSVELSEADDYDGGSLEIVPDSIGISRSLPRGGARFFPSRALHRVTPVTRGVRHALVVWTGWPG
jgi:PKHD-type hydroxylase